MLSRVPSCYRVALFEGVLLGGSARSTFGGSRGFGICEFGWVHDLPILSTLAAMGRNYLLRNNLPSPSSSMMNQAIWMMFFFLFYI